MYSKVKSVENDFSKNPDGGCRPLLIKNRRLEVSENVCKFKRNEQPTRQHISSLTLPCTSGSFIQPFIQQNFPETCSCVSTVIRFLVNKLTRPKSEVAPYWRLRSGIWFTADRHWLSCQRMEEATESLRAGTVQGRHFEHSLWLSGATWSSRTYVLCLCSQKKQDAVCNLIREFSCSAISKAV